MPPKAPRLLSRIALDAAGAASSELSSAIGVVPLSSRRNRTWRGLSRYPQANFDLVVRPKGAFLLCQAAAKLRPEKLQRVIINSSSIKP
jgi:hypothetical protein